jgi:hypothetical protein
MGLVDREGIGYLTFPHLKLGRQDFLFYRDTSSNDLYDKMRIYYSIVEVISQAFG